MVDLHDDDHLFEDVSPESPGTIMRRRLGLASQVAEAIRSTNNNTRKSRILSTEVFDFIAYVECQTMHRRWYAVTNAAHIWFHATCMGYDEEHADIKMW